MSDYTVFKGNPTAGTEVDLVSWCGLPPLSDEQHDALWGSLSEQDLLELCASAELCFFGEDTDDSFYQVDTDDPEALKAELRSLILKLSRQA